MIETIHETIEWHRDPADLPDADTTVLIELDPAFDYSEPVFMGFYGDGVWHDVHGEVVEVVAWAALPWGARREEVAREAAGLMPKLFAAMEVLAPEVKALSKGGA